MNDVEAIKIHFDTLAATTGWSLVKTYMEDKITYCKNKLVSTDPNDTVGIAQYQQTIKAYNELIALVNKNISK